MLSGLETLGHLDGTLNELRKQLDSIDRELQSMSGRLAKSELHQTEIIKQLAATRLDAITSNEISARLDSVDRRVREILEQRADAVTKLNQVVRARTQSLAELESSRSRLHTSVDEAAALLAEREARVQEKLATDEAFQTQLEVTQAADSVALSAEEKAKVAAADQREKRGPYDRDPLFTYLWQRRYGTSEYRANPLARALDAWVARLCKYEAARQNYWMLLEIPKRLEQHAAKVRADATAELAKLQSLEVRAAEQGGVTDARAALAATEVRQDEADAKIEALELELHNLRSEQGSFAAGADEYLQKCLATLEAAMKHGSLEDLVSLARSTMTLEDDRLVEALRRARHEERELHGELEEHRNIHREMLRRLQELSGVRGQFKRQRYDDLRSGFDNGDMLLTLLQQVVAGTLRSGILWDALRRSQRYRDVAGAWPDFGSGGITRRGDPPRGKRPTWHWPGRSGGGKGFKLPSGGGRSRGRGGFRTGGGF